MAARLLLLNGVAILGVILFHATGFGFTAMFFWAHRIRAVTSPNFDAAGSLAYYALRLDEQAVASFCIPAFLFVSGYFAAVMAGRNRAGLTLRSIAARARRLAIPYLVWSAVVLVALAVQGRVYAPGRYAWMLLTGASHPNYYFVPLLIQYYALAPLLVRAATWNWRALLVATGCLQLAVYGAQYAVVVGPDASPLVQAAAAVQKWLFVAQLFWFTTGVVAGFEQQAFAALLRRTRLVWAAAAVAFFAAGVVEWEWLLHLAASSWRENRTTIVDGIYAGAAILAVLGYADRAGRHQAWLADLGGKSLGIYLAHGLVMEFVARGLYHFWPWALGVQALFQVLLVGLGLFVPLALMEAVRRSRARVLYPYLFG